MLVRFKQDWFGPGEHMRTFDPQVVVVPGLLYPRTAATDPPRFVPDEYKDLLPYNATIVTEEGEASRDTSPAPAAAGMTLRDFDHVRQEADITDAMTAKAEAFRAQVEAERRKPRRA